MLKIYDKFKQVQKKILTRKKNKNVGFCKKKILKKGDKKTHNQLKTTMHLKMLKMAVNIHCENEKQQHP